MKLFNFVIVVMAALAVGGLMGFTLGGQPLTPVGAPQSAPIAQPAVDDAAAPVEAKVGLVGVLQAVGADALSVQTREGMQILAIGNSTGIEQLRLGDKVAVWAQSVNGRIVVRQISVIPQSPERVHYLGLVAGFAPDHIDVVGQQGETTSFRMDSTVQWMPDAARAPHIGDTVTVVGKPDPLGDGWLAVAVVLR